MIGELINSFKEGVEDYRFRRPPFWLVAFLVISTVATWLPLAIIARARVSTSPDPRIHLIQDMDNQVKSKAQSANALFADGRSERPMIAGTVARGQLMEDDAFYRGYTNVLNPTTGKFEPKYIDGFPTQVQAILDGTDKTGLSAENYLLRGQQKFAVNCSACHGLDGSGLGRVQLRVSELTDSPKWVQPSNLHEAARKERPNGHLYNTINNGIRSMGGYGHVITPEDRWAIVAYIRALQFSQEAPESAAPAGALPK